jgi:hypothetical protein
VSQIEAAKTSVCTDDCCAPTPLVLPPRPERAAERQALIRQAFWLEWLTIGWMTVEAAVAIGAGVTAGSLVLTAFGLDSLIELASAGVLIWRLTVELRHGERFSEETEKTASRIAGALLLALAAYVTVAAAWSLWTRSGEAFLMARPYRRPGRDSVHALSRLSQDRGRREARQPGLASRCNGSRNLRLALVRRRYQPPGSMGSRRVVDRRRRVIGNRLVSGQRRPSGVGRTRMLLKDFDHA